MLAQIKDMIRTTRVLLLSMESYKGAYITANNLPFSEAMLNLTERPSVNSILNEVHQLTRNYNCSPHLPLWMKLIKCNGFLAPTGMWFGGFSSWLFCLGFSQVLDNQDQLWLKTSASLEGERKASTKDLKIFLGITTYAKPKLIEEAIKILLAVTKLAMKLVGDQLCIALMGYTHAAELMCFHDQPIATNMDWVDRFLVKVLQAIDREVQIAFNVIYN